MVNLIDEDNKHLFLHSTHNSNNSFIANVNKLASNISSITELQKVLTKKNVESLLVLSFLNLNTIINDINKGSLHGLRKLDINLLKNFKDYEESLTNDEKKAIWNDVNKQVYYESIDVYFKDNRVIKKTFNILGVDTPISNHHQLYTQLDEWNEFKQYFGYTMFNIVPNTPIENHELLRINDGEAIGSTIEKIVLNVASEGKNLSYDSSFSGAKEYSPIYSWVDSTSSIEVIVNEINELKQIVEYLPECVELQKYLKELTEIYSVLSKLASVDSEDITIHKYLPELKAIYDNLDNLLKLNELSPNLLTIIDDKANKIKDKVAKEYTIKYSISSLNNRNHTIGEIFTANINNQEYKFVSTSVDENGVITAGILTPTITSVDIEGNISFQNSANAGTIYCGEPNLYSGKKGLYCGATAINVLNIILVFESIPTEYEQIVKDLIDVYEELKSLIDSSGSSDVTSDIYILKAEIENLKGLIDTVKNNYIYLNNKIDPVLEFADDFENKIKEIKDSIDSFNSIKNKVDVLESNIKELTENIGKINSFNEIIDEIKKDNEKANSKSEEALANSNKAISDALNYKTSTLVLLNALTARVVKNENDIKNIDTSIPDVSTLIAELSAIANKARDTANEANIRSIANSKNLDKVLTHTYTTDKIDANEFIYDKVNLLLMNKESSNLPSIEYPIFFETFPSTNDTTTLQKAQYEASPICYYRVVTTGKQRSIQYTPWLSVQSDINRIEEEIKKIEEEIREGGSLDVNEEIKKKLQEMSSDIAKSLNNSELAIDSIDTLESNVNLEIKRLDSRIDDTTVEVTALKENIELLQSKINVNIEDINNLKENVKEIDNLKIELSDIEKSILNIEENVKEIEELKNKIKNIDKIESNISDIEDRLTLIEDKIKTIDELKEDINEAKNDITETINSISDKIDEAISNNSDIKNLKESEQEIKKEIESILDKVNDITINNENINKYKIVNEEINANDYGLNNYKLFINNNSYFMFPANISSPFYFTVELTDDYSTVLQIIQSKNDLTKIYYRIGNINKIEEEDDTSSNSYCGDNNLFCSDDIYIYIENNDSKIVKKSIEYSIEWTEWENNQTKIENVLNDIEEIKKNNEENITKIKEDIESNKKTIDDLYEKIEDISTDDKTNDTEEIYNILYKERLLYPTVSSKLYTFETSRLVTLWRRTGSIFMKAGTKISLNNKIFSIDKDSYFLPYIKLDTGVPSDYKLEAGVSYYIYIKYTDKFDIVVSKDNTLTFENGRMIGGFHTLCADITHGLTEQGNGTTNHSDEGLNYSGGRTHKLNGGKAGDVIPASLWDISFRPFSYDINDTSTLTTPMVYITNKNVWVDIYLNGKETYTSSDGIILNYKKYLIDDYSYSFNHKRKIMTKDIFYVLSKRTYCSSPFKIVIEEDIYNNIDAWNGGVTQLVKHAGLSNSLGIRNVSDDGVESTYGVAWNLLFNNKKEIIYEDIEWNQKRYTYEEENNINYVYDLDGQKKNKVIYKIPLAGGISVKYENQSDGILEADNKTSVTYDYNIGYNSIEYVTYKDNVTFNSIGYLQDLFLENRAELYNYVSLRFYSEHYGNEFNLLADNLLPSDDRVSL